MLYRVSHICRSCICEFTYLWTATWPHQHALPLDESCTPWTTVLHIHLDLLFQVSTGVYRMETPWRRGTHESVSQSVCLSCLIQHLVSHCIDMPILDFTLHFIFYILSFSAWKKSRCGSHEVVLLQTLLSLAHSHTYSLSHTQKRINYQEWHCVLSLFWDLWNQLSSQTEICTLNIEWFPESVC